MKGEMVPGSSGVSAPRGVQVVVRAVEMAAVVLGEAMEK